MYLFVAFLQHITNWVYIRHIFELIVKQLYIISFHVFKHLNWLAFNVIVCPHGTTPKYVDIKWVLNVLLFDLFIELVTVDNPLVNSKDSFSHAVFLLCTLLNKIEAMELHIHGDIDPIILKLIVLMLHILNIILQKELPSVEFVDIESGSLCVNLREEWLYDL